MTFDLELKSASLKSGKHAIAIRVTVGKDVKRRNTDYAVFPKDWDNEKKQVKRSHPNYSELNTLLLQELNMVERVGLRLRASGHVEAKTVLQVAYLKHNFVDFIEAEKKRFEEKGQYAHAKKTGTLIGLLKEFSPNIQVEDITPEYLERFRLSRKKKAHNTIISNMTMLRTYYRAACKSVRYKPEFDPFDEITVGTFVPGEKQVLTMEEIAKLYQFEGNEAQTIARDVFLTSFYLAGLRFGDTLRLKWADIHNGRVSISPSKTKGTTGVKLNMPIHPKLAAIFKRYDNKTSTIFNLVTTGDAYEIDKLNANLGKTLKLVLLGAGISKNVSYSCARNTFAQLANDLSGRDVYSIKTALGHSKMSTTEIYLGQDVKAVNDLMRKVYGK